MNEEKDKIVEKIDGRLFLQLQPQEVLPEIDFLGEKKLNLQIVLSDTRWLWRYQKSQLDEIKSQTKKANIRVSLHGPFIDLNIGSEDEAIRAYARKCYLRAAEVCTLLEGKGIVFHSGLNPLIPKDFIYKWVDRSLEGWEEILKSAEERDTKFLLENGFDPIPDILAHLLNRLGEDRVKVCFDAGHANVFSEKPIKAWLDKLGDWIAQVDMHDNNGDSDDHKTLGEGNIDFGGLFNELEKMDLAPNLNLEMNRNSVAKSLDYLKNLELSKKGRGESGRPKIVITDGVAW